MRWFSFYLVIEMDAKLIECQTCGINGIHACLGVKQKDVDLFALAMKANTFPFTESIQKCLVCGGGCGNLPCRKTAITSAMTASTKAEIVFYKRDIEVSKK